MFGIKMTNQMTKGRKFKGWIYKSLGVWTLLVSFFSLGAGAFAAPVANANDYLVTTGTILQIPAGGVLTNDTPSSGLTAVLVTSPSHGTLTLTNNGGFSYTPSVGFIGTDTFTYRASDGATVSAAVPVTITVRPVGAIFYDNFSRSTNASLTAPWTPVLGQWSITGDELIGTHTGSQEYEDFYVSMNLTDFRLQGRVQLPQGAWGGGFAGRLNASTGAKYMAVIYPAGSQGSGGLPLMRLIKFHTWNSWNSTFTPMAEVSLPDVGTNWHTERLEFRGTRVMVYLDDILRIDATDNNVDGLPPLTNGGFAAHMYSENSFYTTHYDDVLVTPLQPVANDDSFTVTTGKSYSSSIPGVLANDLNGVGSLLVSTLVTGPSHGTVALSTNGSFIYTPAAAYLGSDSFTYADSDGSNTSPPATVSITIVPNVAPDTAADYFTYTANTPLVVAAPGVLTNDVDANGDGFFASLVSGPNYGTLILNTNGGFTYTPSTNFTGLDQFVYTANDGAVGSRPTTVFLKTQPPSLFSDSFSHAGTLSPWVLRDGNWNVSGAVIDCGPNAFSSYGNVYLTNVWTDFTVQSRIRLPEGAFGASLGGRLDRTTGAQYTAWVYPENSPGGSNVLKLIKFSSWTAWGYQGASYAPMAQVNLPSVGTNWHKVNLSFHDGNRIAVSFDDVPYISVFDLDPTTYPEGGVSLNMWTDFVQYQASFEDVIVTPLVNDVAFSTPQNKSLTAIAPGVTANCTPVYNTNLTAVLITSPTNGVLSFSTNGAFVYTPNINLRANDTFTCRINDGDTNLGTARVTITVTPAILTNQTINFPSIAAKTYGDTPFALLATASSGLPVSYSVLSGPATVSSGLLTITGNGTVAVRASQSGDLTNYSAAANVDQFFTVTRAALVVTADSAARLYGATNPVLTVSYSGFVNGESAEVLAGVPALTVAASSNTPPGNYAITAGPGTLSAANYDFTYTAGTLTISPASLTVRANAEVRVYGATNPVFTASYSGFVNSETLETSGVLGSPLLECQAGISSPVGSYTISCTNGTLASSNYSFSFVNNSLAVTPALLTVAADHKSRLYGLTNPLLTATISGFLNDDTVSTIAGVAELSCAATETSAVDTYEIAIALGSLASTNYSFILTNGTLTVGKATLVVTADSATRLYGATNPVLTVSYSGFVNGESAEVLAGVPALTVAASSNTPPGNYAITAGPGTLSAANYDFTYTAGTLTISPASLTVRANAEVRVYGATNPVFTASYSGFVNSETLETSGVLGSPLLECQAGISSPVGSYTISCTNGTLASSNYSFSFVNNSLAVTTAAASITWSNPVDIVHGVALSSTQLNAVGSVGGTFAYAPVAGTVLAAGSAQALTVTLTPTDTNYTPAVATVFINVLQATTTNLLLASENPAVPGDAVTFTSVLSVVAPGAGMPVGQVEFAVDGSTVATSEMTNGVARFSTSTLAHGAHVISARFVGDSQFSGCSNTLATLEIIDRAPVTGVMLLGTKLGLPLTLNVTNLMEMASDPEGDTITFTNISSTSANGGLVSVNSGIITYTPPTNATGSDSFSYRVADSLGLSTVGLVTIINSQSATVITPVQMLTNGHVVVYFAGAPGHSYTVRASADLSGWSDIGNVTADSNGAVQFEDAAANTLPYRFYRIAPGL